MAGFLIGAAVGAASQTILSPITTYISAQLAPGEYVVKQDAWRPLPMQFPTADAIIAAVNRDLLRPEYATSALSQCGIFWRETDEDIRISSTRLADNAPLHFREQTGLSVQAIQRQLQDNAVLWRKVFRASLAPPDIGMATDLFMRRVISQQQMEAMIRRAGGDVDSWRAVVNALYTPLGLGEIYQARNRGLITDDRVYQDALSRLGHNLPRNREILDKLRYVLPDPGTLMTLALRGIWSATGAEMDEWSREMPGQLRDWLDKNGLGDHTDATGWGGRNVPGTPTWSELVWAQARTPLSVGEAIDALRRHRPNRMGLVNGGGVNAEPFTVVRLMRDLQTAGYSERDRNTIAALAYRPVPMRNIRTAIQLRTHLDTHPDSWLALDQATTASMQKVTRSEAIEGLVDNGYTEDDATVNIDAAIAAQQVKDYERKDEFTESTKRKHIQHVIDAYAVGMVTKQQARDSLLMPEVNVAAVDMALDDVDVEKNLEAAKQVTEQIRHDFDVGITSAAESLSSLLLAGIIPDVAQWYVAHWTVQRNHSRKVLSAQQTMTAVEHGLLSAPEGATRLQNLGFPQADILVLVRGAQHAVDQLSVKQMAAADRSRHQAAHQLAGIAAQAEKQRKAAVAQLRHVLPKSVLIAALKKGTVSPPYVQQRLREQGYSTEDIDLEIRNALTLTPKKATGGKLTTAASPSIPAPQQPAS